MKNQLIASLLLLFSCSALADTCPAIKDIQHHNLSGWKAYDSDDDTPLTGKRLAEFKKNVAQFALAEWKQGKRKANTMHCYYSDTNGSHLEAYIAKENFVPLNAKQYWYEVSGFMHCAAGAEKCEFQSEPKSPQQFAKK